MPRSTRTRRGDGVAAMQDDPEAILRSRRQTTRAARGRAPHSRTGSLSLPQTRGAEQDDHVRQSTQEDAGAEDTSEQTQASPGETEAAAQPANEEHDDDLARQNAATNEEQGAANQEQEDDVSGAEQNHTDPPRESDQPNPATDAGEETIEDAREETAQNQHESNDAQTNTNDTSDSAQADDSPSLSNAHRTNPADEEQAESDLTRPQQAFDDGPTGNQETAEQPALTPCQRMRAALEALQRDAIHAPALHQDITIDENRDLPIDALHLAIASVTEAISDQGHVSFSLTDRVYQFQQAARPGATILWPQHRARGTGRGGHFSLFIAHLDVAGNGYQVEHRDSYPAMRNIASVQDTWRDARIALTGAGVFQWDRLNPSALPEEAQVPDHQFNQRDNWTCGLFTIINAWMHALGLPHAQGHRQTVACVGAASDLVRYAMQGLVSSATIRDFLECFGFIDDGVEVDEDRTFDHTFALPSGAALVDRIARVRLGDELALFLQDDPIENLPSVDGMIDTLEQEGRPFNLSNIESLQGLVDLYRDAINRRMNGGTLDEDEDAAMARRMQQEEYQQDEVPGQQQAPADQQVPQAPDAPQQQADVRTPEGDAAARQRPQAAAGQAQQANPLAQGNAAEQREANLPQGAQLNPLFVNPGAVEQINRMNEEIDNRADAQPPANMQNRPPAEDEGPTAEQAQQYEEAERRRQRAFDLLRPADDPFRPDAPLRAPSATTQRGMDAGFSELSMLVAPYSDLPRHQDIREQFNLPNLTHAFDAGTQQQGAQPAQAAVAPAGGAVQQNQPAAPAALQQGSDAGQDQQPNLGDAAATLSNATQDPPAATETSAPAVNAPAQPPAAGQPAIPGLQSTIPAAPTSDPQRQNPAGATDDQAPPGTRGASAESQDSLRSYEYYERQDQELREEARQQATEAERQQRLDNERQEFEQETNERRQRARERRLTQRTLEDEMLDLGPDSDSSEEDDLDDPNARQRAREREAVQQEIDDEILQLGMESESSEEHPRREEQHEDGQEREEQRTRDDGLGGASNEEQAMRAARGVLDALRAEYGPLPVDEEEEQQHVAEASGRVGGGEEAETGYDSLFEGDVEDDSGTEAGDGVRAGDEGEGDESV